MEPRAFRRESVIAFHVHDIRCSISGIHRAIPHQTNRVSDEDTSPERAERVEGPLPKSLTYSIQTTYVLLDN